METLNINKDGNIRLTLQPLGKKNNNVILFELGDSENLNEHGTPDEFWMTIDRKKLKRMADFIYVYLEEN
jgi:hypothetical protein